MDVVKPFCFAGAVAVSAVVVAMAPKAVWADQITLDGTSYEITYISGSVENNFQHLHAQPWWGDERLAEEMARQLELESSDSRRRSMRFAYSGPTGDRCGNGPLGYWQISRNHRTGEEELAHENYRNYERPEEAAGTWVIIKGWTLRDRLSRLGFPFQKVSQVENP